MGTARFQVPAGIRVAGLALGFAGAVACGLDLMGAGPDSVRDDGGGPEASLPPRGDGSLPGDAAADAIDEVTPRGCPSGLPGPLLVMVGDAGFCIDSTEVTNRQYDEFVTATDGGAPDAQFGGPGSEDGGLPAVCQSQASYRRRNDGGADLPVSATTFCDAYAYCAWAGKRLCGGGPPVDTSEWRVACTRGGAREYPYGDVFDAGACNLISGPETGPKPVKSTSGCEGGYSGIFDMVGNVAEWVGNCSGATCMLVGGFYGSTTASCKTAESAGRTVPIDGVGIRCCR